MYFYEKFVPGYHDIIYTKETLTSLSICKLHTLFSISGPVLNFFLLSYYDLWGVLKDQPLDSCTICICVHSTELG
jgi:hypothetical protein